jgi:phenylpropionate dioxygenase-like ring-hydroxylating dioxygenase large terminal subunit
MATLVQVETGSQLPVAIDPTYDLGPGAHECWYPVALSSQVPAGKAIGRDLGDGRIVIYRGNDGAVRALSAYCKHMGADLSFGGEVMGNDIRCPFHHWSYGDGGRCTNIPSGDAVPKRARLAELPSKEQYGLIWVFFGEKPLYELQTFPDFNEEDYIAKSYEIQLSDKLLCEPWMFTTNIFDFVHLRFLHKIHITNSKIEEIDTFRRRMVWEADMGEKAGGGWRPEIYVYGMNSIRTMGDQDGRLKWYIAASAPLGREGTKFFITVITTRGEGDIEFLDRQAAMHTAIMNEDVPVLNNLRYGNFLLVPSDKAMTRFIRSVLKYPRTTMRDLERAAAMAET